ncbi:Alcohol dehydrogenase (quinone), cytochrome c subunit [Polaromonas vacuolata]|uniref:Alcohol dehydrogenase (Quinone), cytochrome c subunit n=1 Tax=Polaromonas vacuolata TaxID=37448 RepID=A0A6H2H7K5_9BURK|nr:cytochrome c [Polaromonas vacuolata]QJC55862.1 Alcohol dehydrogenase (quinone), cytochrome c subunit [Polaromonas vacuolata]
MKIMLKIGFTALLTLMTAGAAVWFLNNRDEVDVDGLVQTTMASSVSHSPASTLVNDRQITRGAYLASAGNCITCHTSQGGAAYAGGGGIATQFGTVYSPNLTPDVKTGLGSWTAAHFWRAMHNGRSKSGRLLYPVFPYQQYTTVTREDSDALFAYFKSLAAVEQANQPNTLRFPYNQQAALAVWRALYFQPASFEPQAKQDAEWNRGAYLINGLGHCAACHTARNAIGGSTGQALGGGIIPLQNWYAPSLLSPHEGGNIDSAQLVTLLKTGISRDAVVIGPMAEVVRGGTAHMSVKDLAAMAAYLKTLVSDQPLLPSSELPVASLSADLPVAVSGQSVAGAQLYGTHCAQCHGDKGEGVAGAYPAMAGNRAVTMQDTSNLVQIVLKGGFAPATAGNPRPYGMPPFVLVLRDIEIAAILTHVRGSWGNQAGLVSPLTVNRIRGR